MKGCATVGDKFGVWWFSGTGDEVGNMYGYRTHNSTLRQHVANLVPVGGDEFEDVLHITPPENFLPREGRTNWLFTMFEGSVVPEIYKIYLRMADYLIVPCQWCRALFGEFYPEERIFVVPHGVMPMFTFKRRINPLFQGKRFRYLWVGAHNPRKGWEELIILWDRAGFRDNPEAELYIKTTNLDRVVRDGNVIVDGRDLPRARLVELYHKAHCFVFPTRGEGFGLTLAEAMRTGLPAIAPYYSGVTEFFDAEVGFPVGYEICASTFTFPARPEFGEQPTMVCFPNVGEIAEQMVWIAKNYSLALKKGEAAHKRIRGGFTWERSARLLVDVMRGAYEQRRKGEVVAQPGHTPEGCGQGVWL